MNPNPGKTYPISQETLAALADQISHLEGTHPGPVQRRRAQLAHDLIMATLGSDVDQVYCMEDLDDCALGMATVKLQSPPAAVPVADPADPAANDLG